MSETVIPFAFDDALVRILMRDGEPWFVLADVCRVLEIGNPSQAAKRLDDDEQDTLTNDEGIAAPQVQSLTIINESGLYTLIMRSRKPEARRFRKWVTGEVLPSIRRTGRYDAGGAPAIEEPTIPPMLSPWEAFRRGDPAGITWFNSIMAGAPFIQRTGGRAGLIAYMREMGIPLYGQPANPVGHVSGGSECLTFLFAGALPDGRTVRDALAAAREGDREMAGVLVGCGLMVTADFGGGLWVANSHPFLTEVFIGTPWAGRKWRDALRLLPGSTSPYTHNRHRFGRQQARATFVPWASCPF